MRDGRPPRASAPASGPPRRGRRLARRGAGALAVAVVLLLAVLRLGWPLAGRYPAEIADWLSAQAGRRVEVAEVRAGWEGWRPNLVLRGVALPDTRPGPHRHALARIASLRLRLDPWATFRHREPRLDALQVRGAALVAFRGADGAFRVPGPGGRPGPAGALALPGAPLLEGAWISVHESRLLLMHPDRAGGALCFDAIEGHLHASGGRRRIRLLGKLHGDPDASVDLAMEIEGDPAAGDWSGRAALRARGLDLRRLGRMAGIPGPGGLEGLAALDLSGFWRSGRLHFARARVDLREAAFAAGGRRVALHAVSAGAAARREAGGWRVEVRDLKVHDGGAEWPASAASFRYRPEDAKRPARLLGRVERLRIEDLLPLLPPGSRGEEDWPAALRELAPSGRIEGLHFALDPRKGWSGVVLRAPFRELATRERPPLPAISGAAGVLELAPGRGALGISRGAVAGSWPEIPKTRVAVPTLSGRLAWLRGEAGGGWLRIADLGFENPHLKGRLRGRVEWPEPGSEALLGLALDLERGDLARLRDYLPEGLLRPRLAAWLREAIHGGRIEQAALRLRGKLDERPFDGPGEIFSARARVSGVGLRYARRWPGIEDLEARLHVEGGRTEIRITGGNVEGAGIARATATITGTGAPAPLLEIEGTVRGRTEQAAAFLRHSPLAPRFARVLDTLDARGPSTLALRVALSLPAGPRRVSGRLEVRDNLVDLPGFAEGVRGINGVFEFRDAAVRAEGVEARYLGRPILLDLEPVAEGRGARIAIEGGATPRDLAAHLRNTGLIRDPAAEAPAWLSPLHGEARWRAVVDVRGAPGEEAAITALRVRSDLRGAGIALPAPFTKAAPEAAELGIDLRFGAGGRRDLELRYGDLLSAALAFGAGPGGRTLERGAVRFGGGVAALPEEAGLEVDGALSHLPLGDWYRRLDTGRRSGSGAAADPRPSPLARVRRVELLAGAPSVFGIEFGATRIDARADPSPAWTISLDGADVQGEIRVPAGDGAARLHFDRLIAHPAPERPRVLDARPPRRAARAAPGHLPDPPAFDFRCAECRLGEHEFRDLEIRARPHPRGTRFPSIRWRGAGYEAEAQGDWLVVDGARRSSVEVRIRSDDLGLLIGTLGGAGTSGVAGAADLRLSARWPGSPLDFDVGGVEGTLHVRVGDGRIPQARPGVAGRLFGLLMLASLPRRLLLDFGDLFQEGFAFDSLEGSFSIASGDALTRDLVIDGATATIELAGRTGLVAEDYDQIATIVPKLSGTLPLAPIWLGQKIFNTRVFDRAFAFRYAIRGPWSEPRIEPLPPEEPETKGRDRR